MAIWLSLKPNGGTELTLVNGDTRTGFHRLSGGDWGQIDNEGIFSGSIDTEGASRVGESVGNRTITLPLIAYDTASTPTAAGLASVRQSLATAVRELNARKGTIRFRPSGLSYGVDFEVEHVKLVGDSWPKLAELGACYQTTMVVTVRPYALMDPLDREDRFQTNTFTTGGKYNNGGADWLALSIGNSSLSAWTVTPGDSLGRSADGYASSVSSLTDKHYLMHTNSSVSGTYADREHSRRNIFVSACFEPVSGSTANFTGSVFIGGTSSGQIMEAEVADDGAQSTLRVKYGGTTLATAILTNRLGTTPDPGLRFWVTLFFDGATLYGDMYTSYPTFGITTPYASVSSTLGTVPLPGGGVMCTPRAAGVKISDFKYWPNTQRAMVMPSVNDYSADPSGYGSFYSIPGNIDALCDIVYAPAASAPYLTGAIAQTRSARNMVPVTTDVSVGGWSASAVAGVIGAGTSVATTTSHAYYGRGSVAVVTPATTDTGAAWKVYGRFAANRTYKFEAYLKGSLATQARIKMGRSGDIGTGTASALSTSAFVKYTVTWTPTANYEYAYIAVGVNAATLTTIYVDEPLVYEPETDTPIAQPRGASTDVLYPYADPPLAVIHANKMGGTDTADVGVAWGDSRFTFTTGVAKQIALIDPASIESDGDTMRIAVWADLYVSSATTGFSIVATLGGNYSIEYGSSGKSIAAPSAGNVYRPYFLGTFVVSNADEFKSYSLSVTPTFGGTAPGIDYVVVAPADSVFGSMTGVTGAAVASIATSENRIGADLSVRKRSGSSEWEPATGLVGNQLRVRPGRRPSLLMFPSSYVTDRTDSNASSRTVSHTGFVHMSIRPRVRMVET